MTRNTHPTRRDDRLYPRWWDHQRHSLVALREALVATLYSQIPEGKGATVVDIGCGDRPYESLIRARGFRYVGCDLQGEPDCLIELGRPIELPDGEAAGIVSFQVLEHVWDLDWYLGECRRLLSNQGWMLLSTHGSWLYHPHPTDYRRWTKDGLTLELETRGFRIDHMEALVGPLAWTTQFRALGFRHVLQQIPGGGILIPPLMTLMNARMMIEDLLTPESIRRNNACVYLALCRRD